jgi:hypothetical protein
MADLTITPGSVAKSTNGKVDHGTAGVAITAGQVVYKEAATQTYKLADNNVVGARDPTGIALNGAAIGQPVSVQQDGDVTIGATMTAGEAYYLSDTPGGICPRADVIAGENTVLIGLAKSTTVLGLNIYGSGVTL